MPGWFDQQAAAVPDLAQAWNAYQAGGPLTARDLTSMDDLQLPSGIDPSNTGAVHRWQAQQAAQRGIIANTPEAIAAAMDEIDRTGRFLYREGEQRTFDGSGPMDSGDIDDPVKRAAGEAASALGHARDDERDLAGGRQGIGLDGEPIAYRTFNTPYSAPAKPSGATAAWGQTFSGPQRDPALAAAYGREFVFDPSELQNDRGYQSEVADTIRATDRSASARGLSFTNQAREELATRVGDLASRRIGDAYGRQLGAFTTNRDTFIEGTGRAIGEADRRYSEAADTADRNYGTFANERGWQSGEYNRDADRTRQTYLDAASIHDTNERNRVDTQRGILGDSRGWDSERWNRGRTTLNDERAWDTNLYGRSDTDRRFAADRDDAMYGRSDTDRRFSAGRDDAMYGRSDTDRRFAADRGDTRWAQGRTDRNDTWGRMDTAWNQGRTDRLDTWGRDDTLWGRGRTDRNDEWSRGSDVWNMGRTDRNDAFDRDYRMQDLILRNRPRASA